MIVCASLAEAIAVPNVVLVVASSPPVAYVKGDVLPAYVVADNTAENTRLSGIDSAIATGTVGTVTPETGLQLKAMTWTQYSTWFDANFTTAAQCIALLKVVLLVLVRRDF